MPKRKARRMSRRGTGGAGGTGGPPERRTYGVRLFSIGHSNHSLEQLLALLQRYGIETVVDARSAPASRYVPHFNAEPLRAALAAAGIAYRYLGKKLGGRPNGREFYDQHGRVVYERLAHSPPFRRGIQRLAWLAERSCVALLCSEENPAACHRRLLIGPAAAANGLVVGHIRASGLVETEAQLSRTGSATDECGDYLQLRLL